jgi:hypothetical protein
MKAGDITYRKDKEVPGEFWHIATDSFNILRFTSLEPNRFLYSMPSGSYPSARFIAGRFVKNPDLHRKRIIKAIFKAKVFQEHSAMR